MIGHRYSQLPVITDDRVQGVFSFWSLAHHLVTTPELSTRDLLVEDVMERIPTVTVEERLDVVLEHLDRYDAVLVDSPHGLQAVATAMDVLGYFYKVARPYVLLQEIELSLRDLIRTCLSEDQLRECASRCLSARYKGREVPYDLLQMTFEDYRSLVTAKDNWDLFGGAFGKNRQLVASKLGEVRRIRNGVFHFRDSVSVYDHETLAVTRNWLFDKARVLRTRLQEGA